MNRHEARQRSDGTGWAWTTENDGVIRTSGGCVTWPDGAPTVLQAMSGNGPRPGEPHAHSTRDEAERCFYDHEASELREIGYTSALRCEHPAHDGDGPWTPMALEARLLGAAWLCDEHRNADGWRAVHPFRPGIAITASW